MIVVVGGKGEAVRQDFAAHLFEAVEGGHAFAGDGFWGDGVAKREKKCVFFSFLVSTKTYLRLVPGHLKADYEKAMPELVRQVRRNSGNRAS